MLDSLEDLPRGWRYVIFGAITLALLIGNLFLLSWLSGELNTHKAQAASFTTSENSGTYSIGESFSATVISAGQHINNVTRDITNTTHTAGMAVVDTTKNSVISIGQAISDGVVTTLRAPGQLFATASHLPAKLAAIITPKDNTKTPVINAETSEAVRLRLSADLQKKVAKLEAGQIAANQGLGGIITAGDPNHGGYPARLADASQDSIIDNWGMYNRECVSYVAWKVYQTFGYMPYWGGVGNANEWLSDARATGIPTGYTPKVHAVAISLRGYYGHAMWVQKVSGNKIYVSQYNYELRGQYSEMWVDASGLAYIYFQ